MSELFCLTCGHPESAHYTYILNGAETTRCRSCDPLSNRAGGPDFVAISGDEARQYRFADHPFEPGETVGGRPR